MKNVFDTVTLLSETPQPTPLDGQPVITLRDLVKVYQTAAGDFPALRGVNASFYPGEFVAIIGKSGAGKSTLVNMITGVDSITSGEVWVAGTPIHTLDENRMALWRGQTVGVVYQSFQLMPTISLLDNVMLPMDFCGLYRPGESEKKALDMLRMVEMEDQALKLPSTISGGQKQRAAIARALANDPPIIVADEPTGNLDTLTADTIFSLFEKLANQGKTILMVTHDLSIASRVSRVLTISDGLISEGLNYQ
jgi:putative ABC transport system ATP-binding protein